MNALTIISQSIAAGGLAGARPVLTLTALIAWARFIEPAQLPDNLDWLDHEVTLGIGAGWFEKEHLDLGFPFGTFGERFERLEEALQIIVPMLRGERPSLDGKYYSATEAANVPGAISQIPIMIGGQGEKKTLRMVAQYADESNLTGEVKDIPRKLEALAGHCERLGRDRSQIKVTKLLMVLVAETNEQVDADLKAMAEVKGWNDQMMNMVRNVLITGDADTVGERIAEAVAMGIDGITVDLPVNGHNTDRIELLGEISRKVLG